MQLAERKAKSAGLELVVNGPLVEARRGKTVIAFHSDADKALAKALERIEADRLRDLDKLPSDREPVLKARKTRGRPSKVEAKTPTPPAEIAEFTNKMIGEGILAVPVKVIKGSIIKEKYKERYKKNGTCGDDISYELREYVIILVDGKSKISLERLKEVATVNDVWKDSYAALNPGQQRMTIGNRLRTRRTAGDVVDIGGAIFQIKFEGL